MARILVVEDEELFRDLYREFLTRHNHDVLLASNADEALAKLKESVPDLLITDLKMPQKSGIDLLEDVADIAPDMPIIVCSALSALKQEVSYFHGGDKFVFHEKPLDFDQLLNDVNRLLAQS